MHALSVHRFRRHFALVWLAAGTLLALALPGAADPALLGWSGLYWWLAVPLLILGTACGKPAPSVQAVWRPRAPGGPQASGRLVRAGTHGIRLGRASAHRRSAHVAPPARRSASG